LLSLSRGLDLQRKKVVQEHRKTVLDAAKGEQQLSTVRRR